MVSDDQTDPYGKLVAALQDALGAGSANALPNLLRTQLQTDSER